MITLMLLLDLIALGAVGWFAFRAYKRWVGK